MTDGTPQTGKSTLCHNNSITQHICLHGNNSEIICAVRPMMNDTPRTGISTSCCNISNTQKQTKTKTENNFEIVFGVRPV